MNPKTIDITCSECGNTITMSAQDAKISWRFNGGCPSLTVRVPCPNCKNSSIVHDTPAARELLRERLQDLNFDQIGTFIVSNS